jgi:hypothetical protein
MLAGGAAVIVLLVALSARAFGPAPLASAPVAAGSTSGAGFTPSASVPSTEVSAPPSVSAQASASTSVTDKTPSPADAVAAKDAVEQYTAALVRGSYATAYGMLAPESQGHWQSLADFIYERSAFFKSVAGRYVIQVWPSDVLPIGSWLTDTNRSLIDLHHAVLVEVDYPAMAGNNAGLDIYIVSPAANGVEIFDVR